MGSSWRARSLIRSLCRAPCSVSRSVARTRRSSAARSAPGSTRGCSPAGSNSGRRARVSASMPLVLVCRDRNRRRSAALADDTRCTTCPRRAKNTAIGNHAGPVGSTTTSNRVPCGQPARRGRLHLAEALDRRPRLALGDRVRLAVEHPHRVRAGDAQVDADQASAVHLVSSGRVGSTGSPAGATHASGHGPKETRANRGSHSCAATGIDLDGPSHFPHPGHPWPAGCGNQTNGAKPSRTSPRADLDATPRTSREDHATLGPRPRGGSTVPMSLT